jgi:hypothetical protein
MDLRSNKFYSKKQYDNVHDPMNKVYKNGQITFLYPPNVKRNTKKEKMLHTIVYEVTKYYKKELIPVSIHIYFGICKKEALSNLRYSLEMGNSNSGFTTFTPTQNSILIHRDEDCMKVLIHELLHAFSMHIGFEMETVTLNMQEFDVLLNEAYIESLALYWYCRLYARFTHKPVHTVLAKCKAYRRELAEKLASMIFEKRAQHKSSNAICYYIFATQAFLKLRRQNLAGMTRPEFKDLINTHQTLWQGHLLSIESIAAINPIT